MPTLYMMCGLPGSGKSTFAKKMAPSIPAVIVSSDDIRAEVFGGYNAKDNERLVQLACEQVREHLKRGENVIFDATNTRKWQREKMLETACGIARVVAVHMATPANVCMYRNRTRDRVVPDCVFRTMERLMELPTTAEGFHAIATYGLPF